MITIAKKSNFSNIFLKSLQETQRDRCKDVIFIIWDEKENILIPVVNLRRSINHGRMIQEYIILRTMLV